MKKILLILTALTVSAAAFAEKITTVAEITSGNRYYIGATTGGDDYYFYVDGSSKTESIKGVAKEDKAEAVALTFTAVTGGWTIKFDNGYYLGLQSNFDGGAVQVMEEPVVWTIEDAKGLLKLCSNTRFLENSSKGFGSSKSFTSGVWLESAGSAPVSLILESVYIKGDATIMEYEVGESFDPAGLEVWGVYTKTVKNDTESQITSGITWSIDPETFTEASDNASVTLSASFKDKTSNDTTITGILVKDDDTEAPENFSAEVIRENTTSNSVELKLYAEDNSGEVIFTIKESGQIVQTANGVAGVEKTVTITDLEANKDYTFVVTAKDEAGNECAPITLKVSTPAAPAPAPCLFVDGKVTINELKDSETIYFQYFTYVDGKRVNGIAGDTNRNKSFEPYDTEGYCEINYTNKDDVKRNFIVNPKIENAVDSIYQGETYLFADTLLTTAGTYQRTIESNTMTLTLKVKQKPAPAPYLFVDGKVTINELKDGETIYFQYFTYVDGKRVNGIAGDTNRNKSFEPYDTEGYCEINYTNKDDVKRKYITNPVIVGNVDSIFQGEVYLFADTLLTTAGTYQRTIESNTMTLTLKVKHKYTTYANWQINYGDGWVWTEMTKVGEGLFKLEILWKGTGFNVKSDDNPIKKGWYDVDDPDVHIAEEVHAPATVDVYLRVIDDEHLIIGIGEAPPVPASGPTVDETGITVNGRKYGFPVRLVKEVK